MSLENDLKYFDNAYYLDDSPTKVCKMVYIKQYLSGPRVHLVSYEKWLAGWHKTGEMMMTLAEYNGIVALAREINKECEPPEQIYEEIPFFSTFKPPKPIRKR